MSASRWSRVWRLGLWSTALTMRPSTTAKQIGTRWTVPSAAVGGQAGRPAPRPARRHPRRRGRSSRERVDHGGEALDGAGVAEVGQAHDGLGRRPARPAPGTARPAPPPCRRRPTPGRPRATCPSVGARSASGVELAPIAPDEGGAEVGDGDGGRVALERAAVLGRARRACGPPPADRPGGCRRRRTGPRGAGCAAPPGRRRGSARAPAAAAGSRWPPAPAAAGPRTTARRVPT